MRLLEQQLAERSTEADANAAQVRLLESHLAAAEARLRELLAVNGERLFFRMPPAAFQAMLRHLGGSGIADFREANHAIRARVDAFVRIPIGPPKQAEGPVAGVPAARVIAPGVVLVAGNGNADMGNSGATSSGMRKRSFGSPGVFGFSLGRSNGAANRGGTAPGAAPANGSPPTTPVRVISGDGTPSPAVSSALAGAGAADLPAGAQFSQGPTTAAATAALGLDPRLAAGLAANISAGRGVDYRTAGALLTRLKATDSAYQALRNEMDNMSNQVRTLETVKKFLAGRVSELEGKVAAAEAARDNALMQKNADHDVLTFLDDRFRAAEEAAARAEAERDEAERSAASERERANAAEAASAGLQSRVEELSAALAAAEARLRAAEAGALSPAGLQVTSDAASVALTLSPGATPAHGRHQGIDSLPASFAAATPSQDTVALQTRVAELERLLAASRARAADLERQLDDASAAAAHATGDAAAAQSESAQLRAKCDSLRAQLAAARSLSGVGAAAAAAPTALSFAPAASAPAAGAGGSADLAAALARAEAAHKEAEGFWKTQKKTLSAEIKKLRDERDQLLAQLGQSGGTGGAE